MPEHARGRLDVLHLVPTFDIGGVEQLLLDRLPRMRRRGLDVGICALGAGGGLVEEFRATGAPVFACGMRSRLWAPAGVAALARVLHRVRPRIVHSHLFWSDLAFWLAGGCHRDIRWVSTKHDEGRWMSPLTRLVEARLVCATQRVLTDSAGLSETRLALGLLPRPAQVLYLGAVDQQQASPAERATGRAALGVPEHARVATCVARLHPVKGHDVLLDAWHIVSRDLPDAHLLLCGTGGEEVALRARAAGLDDPRRVHFLGLRRDMQTVYHASDLLVLPSRSEGFPVSILEAMSAALPVVASRVGGIPEAVEDGVTGMLVEPGQPAALAAALVTALSDPDLQRRQGGAARRAYDARFTAEREVDAVVGIYRELLSPPASGKRA